jgi:undecaprenyl-diphosphatase
MLWGQVADLAAHVRAQGGDLGYDKPDGNRAVRLAPPRASVLFGRMFARLHQFFRRSGWKEFVLLIIAGTFCLCLWGFVELADDAVEGDYDQFENQIMRSLRQPDDLSKPLGPWWSAEMARDITALGGATVLSIMTTLVVGYLLIRRAHATVVLVLVAMLGGYGLSNFFKNFFERPRPSIVPHLAEVVSASFPSGHSMVSSVMYLTLGSLLARTVARRREKVYFVGASIMLTFLIGLSRVYLGVHYPTDVLAGWSAGIAWALLCWTAAYWLQRHGKLRGANATESDTGSGAPTDPA